MNATDDLDLRLVWAAAAAWIALLLVGSASAGAALLVGLGGLVAGFVLLRRRRVGMGGAVATACFAVALVLLPLAARIAHERQSPLRPLAAKGAVVTLEVRLTADPHPVGAGSVGPPRVAVPAKAAAMMRGGQRIAVFGNVVVLAPASSWQSLLPGQKVLADGRLSASISDPNGVTFSVQTSGRAIGRPPWWQRAAGRVRSSLQAASAGLPDGPRGLLPGLVDGDTSRLDPVLTEHFRIAGLTHLVAVSGMNCSLLVGAVLLALRRMGARPLVSAAAAAVVLVAFVVVARPSPSVLRAAVMACVTLAALAAGRPRQGVPALAAAVLALLVLDPGLAHSAGFAMSAFATAALLLLAPGWSAALRRRRVPAGLAEAVAVAAAAHVVTAPVVAALSGRISLVAIPANVLAEPVVAVTTVLGFLAALTAPVCMPVAEVLTYLAGWPCRWLVFVADRFGELTGAAVPWPAGVTGGLLLAAVAALLIWSLRVRRSRAVVLAAAVVLLAVQWPVRWVVSDWPQTGAMLVACDVGQGDALVVPVAPNSAVVVDTGPEPIAVDRCLHDLGIADIPLLVLTHMHLDHVGGLAGAMRGRSVGAVVTGPSLDPEIGTHFVEGLLRQRSLSMGTLTQHEVIAVGAARIEVLGPRSAFHDTRSDPNNSSVALRVTVGGVRLLLAADMELEAQRELLDEHADVRADVLKVPHHGSAYSDAQFLAAVGARVGVISVGAHNDYGHPAQSLLRTLVGLGFAPRRTDLDGDVAFLPAGGGVQAVVRGTANSELGLAQVPQRTPLPSVSFTGVRMNACPPDRSALTTFPTRFPASSWSWATRSSWSPAPSARSPPRCGGRIPSSSSPSSPVRTSPGPSCMNCSARRCSATAG